MPIIVGVDEAGRGALIGDVVASAVILPENINHQYITDSKKLNERQRNIAADYIKSIAIEYTIGRASAKEIDTINIHHATLLAMTRAINQLKTKYDEIWIDGKFIPKDTQSAKAFVKGDLLYQQIAAASIIAKTTRDHDLHQLDQLYPNYGFQQHKGYPTQSHIKAIQKYGLLDNYRQSYKTIKAIAK